MKKVLLLVLVVTGMLLTNRACCQVTLAEGWKKVPLSSSNGWKAEPSDGGTVSVGYSIFSHILVTNDGTTEITFTPDKTEMKKSDRCKTCVVRTAEGKDAKNQLYQGTFIYKINKGWIVDSKDLIWIEVKLVSATGTSAPIPKKPK